MTRCANAIAWLSVVGNVALNFTTGNLWVNRAQIRGFVCPSYFSNVSLVGDIFAFEYTPFSWRWELQVHPKFFPPTSNTYNFDYLFLLSNCWSYVSGVPSPLAVNIGLMFVTGEGFPRIGVNPPDVGAPANAVNLAPLAGYWYTF